MLESCSKKEENPDNINIQRSKSQDHSTNTVKESKLFQNKKIYVEIFNNSNDMSDLLDDIVIRNGGQVIEIKLDLQETG
jgi:hypothetical protein